MRAAEGTKAVRPTKERPEVRLRRSLLRGAAERSPQVCATSTPEEVERPEMGTGRAHGSPRVVLTAQLAARLLKELLEAFQRSASVEATGAGRSFRESGGGRGFSFTFQEAKAKVGTSWGFHSSAEMTRCIEAISACGRAKRWQRALELLSEVFERHLEGDAFTLASSISACERASAWHAAWYLLQLSCPQFCSEELCSLVALNSAASAAAKGSEWQLALQVLSKLEDRLLKPDIITYNSLINACANGAQWICALALWSSLPQKISPTMITCSSLLDAFRQSAQWQYALLLVASHRLDMTSYSVAISTCGEAAEWRRGLQLLQDFESVHRPMVIVYNAAISACGGEWLQALGVFNECLKRSLQPDIVTYNALMNVGQKSGRGWEDAIFLLQMAQDATLQPTPSTYTSLFGACRQHGKWRLCLQLLAEAPQSLSTAAYNAAMSCMAENWRHAIGLLEHCPSPDLVTFNALLSAFEKAAQWPRALELLTTSTLRRVALRPDVISFNAAISACEKAEEWPHALHVLSLLRSAALQPTLVSCSATASACEKAGKWQLAGLLLTEVKTMRMQPDLIIYNAAITACEQAGQWQVAFSLLEQAEKSELKPNEITYQAVIVSSERLAWPATLTLLGAAAAADALTPLSVAAALRALREGARFTRASLGPKLLEQLQDRAEVMLIETWPRRDICSRRLLSQRHLSQRAF
ncbi:unnamed protein product [Durusdinium trenchii]|uniref:Pentatricopeptide repeat-containing protein, chloroplastic n=1 Tax=Durusdinium trenchii TaxID=1381693 RepID=A0ABP0SAE7_9DINO